MAKMRGFLHSKPKIDDAEWALAQSRTAERLAGLFSDLPEDEAQPADAPEPERPPIVVVGAAPLDQGLAQVAEAEPVAAAEPVAPSEPVVAEADSVGVMAPPEDRFDENGWQLPTLAAETDPAGLPRPARAAKTAAPAAGKTAASRRTKSGTAALPAKPARARKPRPKRKAAVKGLPAAVAHCPYCALLLDPAPTASRRCERCRQRIMVKRVDGQPVYLTEAAVAVFDAERKRVSSAARLGRERTRWLGLAVAVAAPEKRHAQLSAARLSDETVAASKALYLSAVDRAVRAARRARDWDTAARLRRDQATALYRAAGGMSKPPAPEVVALYRDGVAAELRGIAEISRDAEVVAATCCEACRADDHKIFRISAELRQPRLPHAGCPRGLCRCRWDLAARDRTTMRRYLRRRPASEASPSPDEVGAPA